MTIEAFLESIKLNFDPKKNESTKQDYSKIDGNQFSRVLDSANKSYNYNFEKENDYIYDKKSESGLYTSELTYYQLNNGNVRDYHKDLNTVNNAEITFQNKNVQSECDTQVNYKTESVNNEAKANDSIVETQKPEEAKTADKTTDNKVNDDKVNNDKNKEHSRKVSELKSNDNVNQTEKNIEKPDSKPSEVKQQTTSVHSIATTDIKLMSNTSNSENVKSANSNNTLLENNKTGSKKIDTNHFSVLKHKETELDNAKKNNTVKQEENVPAKEPQKAEVQESKKSNIPSEKVNNDSFTKNASKVKQTTDLQQKVKEVTEQKPDEQLKTVNPEIAKKQDVKIETQTSIASTGAQSDNVQETKTLSSLDKSKNVVEKYSDKLEKVGDEKSNITKVETQSSNKEANLGQNQQNSENSNIKLSNNILQGSDSITSKINTDKTIQFGKILEAKSSPSMSESVLNQVMNKISSELNTEKSQVIISLRPENLGKVELNLVSKNGTLTAEITAENSKVKDILNQNIDNLKQRLEDQGVNVGKLVVQVQESSSNSNHNLKFDQNSQKFDHMGNSSSNKNSDLQDQESGSGKHNNAEADNKRLGEDLNLNDYSGNNYSQILHEGKVDYRV